MINHIFNPLSSIYIGNTLLAVTRKPCTATIKIAINIARLLPSRPSLSHNKGVQMNSLISSSCHFLHNSSYCLGRYCYCLLLWQNISFMPLCASLQLDNLKPKEWNSSKCQFSNVRLVVFIWWFMQGSWVND
jgi:hypothetical protein